jgi:hypothetical protein
MNRRAASDLSLRIASRHANDPKIRAVRKELLLARAEVERFEIAQASAELKHDLTSFTWIRWLLPRFRGRAFGGLPGIGKLLKQYPMVGSLVSLLVAAPGPGKLLRRAKPLLKWGAALGTAWQAYKFWRQANGKRSAREATRAGGAAGSPPEAR